MHPLYTLSGNGPKDRNKLLHAKTLGCFKNPRAASIEIALNSNHFMAFIAFMALAFIAFIVFIAGTSSLSAFIDFMLFFIAFMAFMACVRWDS